MFLRCWLIHVSIIILRRVLYLLYLCSSLDLCLFMSYLCDLFFLFVFIFIMINRTNADAFVLLLIVQNMSYYFWMRTWMRNANNFQQQKFSLRVILSICLIFCVAYKSVACKKKHVTELKKTLISYLDQSLFCQVLQVLIEFKVESQPTFQRWINVVSKLRITLK